MKRLRAEVSEISGPGYTSLISPPPGSATGWLIAGAFEVHLAIERRFQFLVKTKSLLVAILKFQDTGGAIIRSLWVMLDLRTSNVAPPQNALVRNHVGLIGVSLATFKPLATRNALGRMYCGPGLGAWHVIA